MMTRRPGLDQRAGWSGTATAGLIAETLTGGSRKTAELARQLLRRFTQEHDIRVLNVAGTRASTEPEVGEFVRAMLDLAFVRPACAIRDPQVRDGIAPARR
jgi:putative molybdenum carrier protein